MLTTTSSDQQYLHVTEIQTKISLRMLYATIGLLVAALAQFFTAIWQARSASKQSATAAQQGTNC